MKTVAYVLGAIFLVLVATHFVPPGITINHKNDLAGPFTVVGTGEMEVVPDVAQMSGGIQVNRVQTAEEAKNRISAVQNKIVESMKKLGIDEVDIKTTQFSVSPEYSYDDPLPLRSGGATSQSSAGSAIEPAMGTAVIEGDDASAIQDAKIQNAPVMIDNPESRIVGYNGYASLTVKVRDSKKVPQVVSAMTAAGANQLGNVEYVVDDMDAVRDEARKKAIDDAKKRAQSIAKQAGIRLGRVTNVMEDQYGGGYYGGYDAMSAKAVSEPAVNPDIAPGSQTVKVTVTLYFETK